MKIVRADKHFYETSGGGVTISGGEPTAQFDFCLALLKAARAESIDTCLDTSGWFDSSQLETLLPWVNLWHYDYKATGHSVHRKLTGVDSDTILLNLETLLDKGASVALRCPIVPGVNDTRAHLDQIAAWRKSGRFFSVEELPYHKTGEPKYCDLRRGVPLC